MMPYMSIIVKNDEKDVTKNAIDLSSKKYE
jgi:hypothetical protein